MSDCATISTPIRPRHSGAGRVFRTRQQIAAAVGRLIFRDAAGSSLAPGGFAWNVFGDGRTVVRSGFGIYRDQLPAILFGLRPVSAAFLRSGGIRSPSVPNPQNAAETLPLDVFATTYHPKFPYALEYNLNVERELAQGMTVSADTLARAAITSLAKPRRIPLSGVVVIATIRTWHRF